MWIGIGVLVVAFVFEGYSWHTARRQLRSESRERQRSMTSHIKLASDPSAPTVFLEDSAALVGVSLALVALVLHATTGWAGWDAAGSIGIGLLLIAVAYLLARRTKGLLLEESAPDDVVAPIRADVGRADWVDQIQDLHAVYVGPSSLLVNVWVVPRAADQKRPTAELLERVDELRSGLLAQPAIAQVTITLERKPQGPAMHDGGGSG